ncbi:MAG: caspase family protein [Bacteroidota bacterium]
MKTLSLIFLLAVLLVMSSIEATAQMGNEVVINLNLEKDVTRPTVEITTIENTGQVRVQVRDEGGIDTVWIDQIPQTVNHAQLFVDSLDAYQNHSVRVVDRRGNTINQEYFPSRGFSSVSYIPDLTSRKSISQAVYHALIIGVEDYQGTGFASLKYPVDNARDLREVLINYYKFSPSNIMMLEDSMATRGGIEGAFDALRAQVGENSNVLVFFAGHGQWDEVSQTGFWIPSGAKKGRRSTYVRISAIQDYVRETNSQHTLVVVDACSSGSIFKSRGPGIENIPRDVQQLYADKSRVAMTSANLEEVPDKSIFMEFLLKELEQNQNKYLRANSLFSRFEAKVIHNSRITPHFEPIPESGHELGDFIFTRQ